MHDIMGRNKCKILLNYIIYEYIMHYMKRMTTNSRQRIEIKFLSFCKKNSSKTKGSIKRKILNTFCCKYNIV